MTSPDPHRDLIRRLRDDARRLPGPSPDLRRAVAAELREPTAPVAPPGRARPHHSGALLALAAAAALLLWSWPAREAPVVERDVPPLTAARRLAELLPSEVLPAGLLGPRVEGPLLGEIRALQRQATTTGSFLARQLFQPLQALRLTPQLHALAGD